MQRINSLLSLLRYDEVHEDSMKRLEEERRVDYAKYNIHSMVQPLHIQVGPWPNLSFLIIPLNI
jgi:hypothetical protein